MTSCKFYNPKKLPLSSATVCHSEAALVCFFMTSCNIYNPKKLPLSSASVCRSVAALLCFFRSRSHCSVDCTCPCNKKQNAFNSNVISILSSNSADRESKKILSACLTMDSRCSKTNEAAINKGIYQFIGA